MASVYEQVYARSMRDPEGFWAAVAEDNHKRFLGLLGLVTDQGESSAIDPI
jgi:hypothetical protein